VVPAQEGGFMFFNNRRWLLPVEIRFKDGRPATRNDGQKEAQFKNAA